MNKLALLAAAALVFSSAARAEIKHPQPPGQASQMSESVSTMVTVTERVHYQSQLTCSAANDNFCTMNFPKPGRKRRLNITRVTCYAAGGSDAGYSHGILIHNDSAGSQIMYHWLPAGSSNVPAGVHIVNSAVEVVVKSNESATAYLALTHTTSIYGFCTLTGMLEKFE